MSDFFIKLKVAKKWCTCSISYHLLPWSWCQVWDLGGQDTLRPSWATYYRGTHAVLLVVDSTDRARIALVKDELFRLLQHDELQQSVVLVFANKQDLKGAMTAAEISDALSLHTIKNHDWHIQACCALTGEGLYDGLEWVAQHVSGQKSASWYFFFCEPKFSKLLWATYLSGLLPSSCVVGPASPCIGIHLLKVPKPPEFSQLDRFQSHQNLSRGWESL